MNDSTRNIVSVLGAGSWGTALAILLAGNISDVRIWGRGGSNQLNRDRANQKYLPGISFPDSLVAVDSIDQCIEAPLNFLVVVPSHAFRATLEQLVIRISALGHNPSNATILWGTKGFDQKTGKLLSEVVEEVFPTVKAYGVISGPSFAKETVSGMPTGLTLACNNGDKAGELASWFQSPTTRVYSNNDITGVQLGGGIKNVMAIATGISDGLGYGANARAALITRGLAEMIRLGCALGGKAETFSGLAGVGDLILTCTDNQSRNRRYGLGIGAGQSSDDVIAEIGQEIEGINTVRELYTKARSLGVDMPITEQVFQVLYHGVEPETAVKTLMARTSKSENL